MIVRRMSGTIFPVHLLRDDFPPGPPAGGGDYGSTHFAGHSNYRYTGRGTRMAKAEKNTRRFQSPPPAGGVGGGKSSLLNLYFSAEYPRVVGDFVS